MRNARKISIASARRRDVARARNRRFPRRKEITARAVPPLRARVHRTFNTSRDVIAAKRLQRWSPSAGPGAAIKKFTVTGVRFAKLRLRYSPSVSSRGCAVKCGTARRECVGYVGSHNRNCELSRRQTRGTGRWSNFGAAPPALPFLFFRQRAVASASINLLLDCISMRNGAVYIRHRRNGASKHVIRYSRGNRRRQFSFPALALRLAADEKGRR